MLVEIYSKTLFLTNISKTYNYKLGNPLEQENNLGPVVKLSAAQSIRLQVKEAISNGAKDIIGKTNFKISEDSYIVFCNADISIEEWEEKLNFDVQVINYKMDFKWVESTLDKIKELLLQDDIPHYSDPDDCDMCRYLLNHNEMKNI